VSTSALRFEPQATRLASQVHPAVRWAFYIFILSLPFEYPKRSIPWEITTITCALFLLATIVQPVVCYRRFPRAAWWFAGFLYAYLLSFVMNGGEYGEEVWRLFLLQLQLVLFLWAACNVLEDERVFRRVPFVLIATCTARALLQLSGIATQHETEWVGGERISALGQNANQSAMIMSAGLVALVGIAYAKRTGPFLRRLLIWPTGAIIGVAIVQNGSRGGMIALGAGVITFMLGGSWLWSRVRSGAVVLLALGFLLWESYNSEGMRNRFEAVTATGYMAGREQLYPEQVRMFLERPLFGYGPITNKYVLGGRLPQQHYERRDAHNLLLEVMTATGIVGLLPFLVGLWLVVRAAWRARKGPAGMGPFALLVAILVENMSGNWIAAPLMWFLFAYALASDQAHSAPAAPVLARGRPYRLFFQGLGGSSVPRPTGGGAC